MNEGRCSSCGAPLLWAVTERGKHMPLSKQTERRRFVVDEHGIARSVVTYEAHWADCPNAALHRRSP